MKFVINDNEENFVLSDLALNWLEDRGFDTHQDWDRVRNHPLLVECVETLGEDANGGNCDLVIQNVVRKGAWFIQKGEFREFLCKVDDLIIYTV